MVALIFVVGLIALAALALRFGRDSRDGLRSAEHDLASYGITWERSTDDSALAATLRAPRRRGVARLESVWSTAPAQEPARAA